MDAPSEYRESRPGAFSPDAQSIVCNDENGQGVELVEISSMKVISMFDFKKPKAPYRCFQWHPDGLQLAMCSEKSAYVWRPSDGENEPTLEEYQAEKRNMRRHTVDVVCV